MKILFITNMYPVPNPPFGIFVKEQIDDIVKSIHCNYDVYYINASERGNIKYIISILSIPLKILTGRFEIIHIHYGVSGLFLLFYKPKVKIFLTLHGSDIMPKAGKFFQAYLTKKILKKVDKVFILNKEMEAIIEPLKVKYEILPCGVNTEFFKPENCISKKCNTKLIVFPGDPSRKEKNYYLFQKVIEYLNLKSSFKVQQQCINNLSREGVRDLLNKADCLLMTSISEGSPQVVKEALSCGLAVVSVPVGDVKLIIEGIPHCYIAETYSVEELGSLVSKSFNNERYLIRNNFIEKKIYDHHSVTERIINSYNIEFTR
jgi:glycosyltransferase involved in cell wall biosynthesis